jgi:hypothetical protein
VLLFCTKTVRLTFGWPSISSSSWLAVTVQDVAGLQIAGGEYLINGETFSGEVVVAESISLVESSRRTSHQLPLDGCVPWGTMVSSASVPQTGQKSLVTSFCGAATAGVTSAWASTVLSLMTEIWIVGVVRDWLAAYDFAV